jgi:CRISPR system Cascade subunit CasE
MANVYISNVRINDERAIAPVVYHRAEIGQALAPEHHVVWSLFRRNEKDRVWLYRRLTDRALRVVSTRAPSSSPYATVVTTREQNYDWLKPDNRLLFKLRANAVKRVVVDGKTRKVDVVMHDLHPLSPEQRRDQREEITRAAYLDWMQRQGEAHGFEVEREVFQVIAHYRERIPRRNSAPIFINCGELVGMLKVTDPDALRTCLVEGFGASRSFGCGLLEVAHVH